MIVCVSLKQNVMCTVLPCGVLAALCVILVATGIDSGSLKIYHYNKFMLLIYRVVTVIIDFKKR